MLGAAHLNTFLDLGIHNQGVVMLSIFVGVLGAAHLNTFLGFGRMSKLLLRSPFVGVS